MSFVPSYRKAVHAELLSEQLESAAIYEQESSGFVNALQAIKQCIARPKPFDVTSEIMDTVLKDEETLYSIKNLREILYKQMRGLYPKLSDANSLSSFMLQERDCAQTVIDNMITEILSARTSLQYRILSKVAKRFL